MERRPVSQRRYRLDLSEDEILEAEVEDALRATPEERMTAAVALLETVYQLWASRGLAEGQGPIHQERRVLTNPKYDLVELVARIPESYKAEEVSFGPPVGKEEW